MSARFLAIGFAASAAWYAWRWAAYGSSLGGFTLRVLAWSFLAAFLGKVAGIASFRYRVRQAAIRAQRAKAVDAAVKDPEEAIRR